MADLNNSHSQKTVSSPVLMADPTSSITSMAKLLVFGSALAFAPVTVCASEAPFDLSADVTVDLVQDIAGDGDRRLRALSNVSLRADLDIAEVIGWRGATAHFELLDNRGARPNDSTATLQGVDNIEVPKSGLRLFEAWLEQDLGFGASIRAGLYDVNSEFYANDAAGLLISPPFGIGSELAATGPNGPSIFPSSALAARLFVPLGQNGGFLRAGVVNARASTLGDDGGVDFSFRDGVLLIAEAGTAAGNLRLSLGGWGYTQNPDNIYQTRPDGSPMQRASYGAYGVVERELLNRSDSQLTMFLRLGLSDPHTTPYLGSLQTGLLMGPVFSDRKSSQLSFGIAHAWVNDQFRAMQKANGDVPADETTVEITYSDEIAPGFAVQPDLQWIHHPGGLRNSSDAVVAAVRVTWSI